MDNKDLMKYITPEMQEIKELQAAYTGQAAGITLYEQEAARQYANQFIESLDEEGVQRHEKILTIKPKATDSLEDRRFRILARYNEQLPYTIRRLHQQLIALCGEGGFTLNRNVAEKKITARVALTAKNNFTDVEKLLDKETPQNTIIDLSLLYNQHSTLAQFTHAQLSAYTHDQLRNEVIT